MYNFFDCINPTILKIPGIFLEECIGKAPITNEKKRRNIHSYDEILQILSIEGREILIDISATRLVVFDFDIYKILDSNTKKIIFNNIHL